MKKLLLTLWSKEEKEYKTAIVSIHYNAIGEDKVTAIWQQLAGLRALAGYCSIASNVSFAEQLSNLFVITNIHELN